MHGRLCWRGQCQEGNRGGGEEEWLEGDGPAKRYYLVGVGIVGGWLRRDRDELIGAIDKQNISPRRISRQLRKGSGNTAAYFL